MALTWLGAFSNWIAPRFQPSLYGNASPLVIAGLDPAIHQIFCKEMGHQVSALRAGPVMTRCQSWWKTHQHLAAWAHVGVSS